MKKYVIPKGKHGKLHFPRFIWNKRAIKLTFRFDSSAIYTTKDPNNQLDWNKIFGYSRGFHQCNSVRLAWRWNPEINKIEIGKYRYIGGARVSIVLCTIDIDETKTIDLWFSGGGKLGYILFPYFGGDETAPHDITIYIDYEFS